MKRYDRAKKHYLKEIPNKKGIYFFYSEDGTLLYIGKANDIQRRIYQYNSFHFYKHLHFKFIEHVRFIDVMLYEKDDINTLEKKLIKKHAPQWNVIHNEGNCKLSLWETEKERAFFNRLQDEIDNSLKEFNL